MKEKKRLLGQKDILVTRKKEAEKRNRKYEGNETIESRKRIVSGANGCPNP